MMNQPKHNMFRDQLSLILFLMIAVNTFSTVDAAAQSLPATLVSSHKTLHYAHVRHLASAARCVKNGDYKLAYFKFKRMAKHGCPYSRCILGLMYKNGIGVEKDYSMAVSWFRLAAQQGFADAERWLGMAYLEGKGVPKNLVEAEKWLKKAAIHGVAEAQYQLGLLYRDSKTLATRDNEWLGEEAKQGLKEAGLVASKIPQIPQTNYQGNENAYSQGLTNLANSWKGYIDVAKQLDINIANSTTTPN